MVEQFIGGEVSIRDTLPSQFSVRPGRGEVVGFPSRDGLQEHGAGHQLHPGVDHRRVHPSPDRSGHPAPPSLPPPSFSIHETRTGGGPSAPFDVPVQLRPPLRKGKWTAEEEAYVSQIINAFNKGLLPLPAGTTLRGYLSEKLHCDPMRITKKFAGASCIGKRIFQPCEHTVGTAEEIERAQRELGELERRFLETVSEGRSRRLPPSLTTPANYHRSREYDPRDLFHHFHGASSIPQQHHRLVGWPSYDLDRTFPPTPASRYAITGHHQFAPPAHHHRHEPLPPPRPPPSPPPPPQVAAAQMASSRNYDTLKFTQYRGREQQYQDKKVEGMYDDGGGRGGQGGMLRPDGRQSYLLPAAREGLVSSSARGREGDADAYPSHQAPPSSSSSNSHYGYMRSQRAARDANMAAGYHHDAPSACESDDENCSCRKQGGLKHHEEEKEEEEGEEEDGHGGGSKDEGVMDEQGRGAKTEGGEKAKGSNDRSNGGNHPLLPGLPKRGLFPSAKATLGGERFREVEQHDKATSIRPPSSDDPSSPSSSSSREAMRCLTAKGHHHQQQTSDDASRTGGASAGVDQDAGELLLDFLNSVRRQHTGDLSDGAAGQQQAGGAKGRQLGMDHPLAQAEMGGMVVEDRDEEDDRAAQRMKKARVAES